MLAMQVRALDPTFLVLFLNILLFHTMLFIKEQIGLIFEPIQLKTEICNTKSLVLKNT